MNKESRSQLESMILEIEKLKAHWLDDECIEKTMIQVKLNELQFWIEQYFLHKKL